jgi:hypothetical protein
MRRKLINGFQTERTGGTETQRFEITWLVQRPKNMSVLLKSLK